MIGGSRARLRARSSAHTSARSTVVCGVRLLWMAAVALVLVLVLVLLRELQQVHPQASVPRAAGPRPTRTTTPPLTAP
jgi:hypothetical protein